MLDFVPEQGNLHLAAGRACFVACFLGASISGQQSDQNCSSRKKRHLNAHSKRQDNKTKAIKGRTTNQERSVLYDRSGVNRLYLYRPIAAVGLALLVLIFMVFEESSQSQRSVSYLYSILWCLFCNRWWVVVCFSEPLMEGLA